MEQFDKNNKRVLVDDEPKAQFRLAVFGGNGEAEECIVRHDGESQILVKHTIKALNEKPFRVAFTGALIELIFSNINLN
jgi:hypothetical protein